MGLSWTFSKLPTSVGIAKVFLIHEIGCKEHKNEEGKYIYSIAVLYLVSLKV